MPAKRINQFIKDLPFDKKLLAAGSILLALSVFFPWYQDLDSFKTGDIFLGVTGPLYLAGFSMLALSIMNIALIISEQTGTKLPFVTFRASSFYMTAGLVTFYLLLMINSVYFHNKFGVNITVKESQFGMFMAFISASLITIGGYMAGREKASLLRDFQEKAQEPLIKIPDPVDMRKPKENLRNSFQGARAEAAARQTQMEDELVAAEEEITAQQTVNVQPAQRPIAAPPENRNYQPYRTDL